MWSFALSTLSFLVVVILVGIIILAMSFFGILIWAVFSSVQEIRDCVRDEIGLLGDEDEDEENEESVE